MAELSVHTGHACASYKRFEIKIPSSDGSSTYSVEYGPSDDPWARGQEFDWECDCQDFQIRRKKNPGDYCKHIKRAQEMRCGWYQAFDPSKQSMRGPLKACPKCGGPVEQTMFLVPGDEKAPASRPPKDVLSESGVKAILDMVHAPPGDSVHERITKLGKMAGAGFDTDRLVEGMNQVGIEPLDGSFEERVESAIRGVSMLSAQLEYLEDEMKKVGAEGDDPGQMVRDLAKKGAGYHVMFEPKLRELLRERGWLYDEAPVHNDIDVALRGLLDTADKAKLQVDKLPYDIQTAMDLASEAENVRGIILSKLDLDNAKTEGIPISPMIDKLCEDQLTLRAVEAALEEAEVSVEGTVPEQVSYLVGAASVPEQPAAGQNVVELVDRIKVLEAQLREAKLVIADSVIASRRPVPVSEDSPWRGPI